MKNVLQKMKFTEPRDKLISQISKHLIKQEKKENQDCMTESWWVSKDVEVLGE